MKMKNKFIIPTGVILFLSMITLAFILITKNINDGIKELEIKAKVVSDLVSLTNRESIWNSDMEGIKVNIASFLEDRDIVRIVVADQDKKEIAKITTEGAISDADFTKALEDKKDNKDIKKDGHIIRSAEVNKEGKNIGIVQVEITDKYLTDKIKAMAFNIAIMAIIIFVLIITTILVVSSIITKPLEMMTTIIKDVANKDLTKKIENYTKDEIADVGNSVNSMIVILEDSVIKISERSLKLTAVSQNLAAASEESMSAIESINTILEKMKEDSGNSLEDIVSINTKMNEMEQYLKVNEDNAEKTFEESKKTVNNVVKGVDIVNGVSESMEGVKIHVENSVSTIDKLAELLEKIDQFSQVITNISSQTNLLALNAAIEAARAGEAGKGFAVVANEVKKLAEESDNAAEEIGNIVKSIKLEAEKTITMMKKTNGIVGDSVGKMRNTKKVLEEIKESGINVGEMIKETNDSIKTQNERQKEAKNDIEKILKSIEKNYEDISQISVSLNEQNGAVRTVTEGATEVVESSEDLTRLVSEFKIKTWRD